MVSRGRLAVQVVKDCTFPEKGPRSGQLPFGMGVFVGKRVGTGTEESKLVEKAFGCSTGVLGSGGSWHKPYWGPGCVQDSACCLG